MEDFKELNFKPEDTSDAIDQILQEKLGVSLETLKQALAAYVQDKAEELALQLPNIVPYGDYEKLLENNDDMSKFLREEASKVENWDLKWIQPSESKVKLLEFAFNCKAVDEGEALKGFVFLGLTGIIKHAFVQGEGA